MDGKQNLMDLPSTGTPFLRICGGVECSENLGRLSLAAIDNKEWKFLEANRPKLSLYTPE
jgi:hypothetical protein